MARTAPSRAFRTRDAHRTWLTLHFIVLIAGVGAAFVANRFVSPEQFWAHWVALGWGAAFAVHAAIFARSTLATMGAKRD